MNKNKKGRSSLETLSNAHQLKLKVNDNSLDSQRQRILNWLRQKPLTTLDARRELDIMAPAARIFELRHDFDFNIVTNWLVKETRPGHFHRLAEYVLLSDKFQGD